MSKLGYVALGCGQALLIAVSALLRRLHWAEIDYPEISSRISPGLLASGYCLAGWCLTILIAAGLAVRDRTHRTLIVLCLVMVLPPIEFMAWFLLAY
ncbi:hypothetical protein AB4851_05780 [Burkholderia sp. 22PA0099]|uniref:hypothetical protein n=1 Tax=Burkholderia sp. 22PA0099 TaxID=3237372 RepID=UPI0039C3D0A7